MAGIDFNAIADQYGYDSNWNALRGRKDPLLEQLSAQYGIDSNWNALRPTRPSAPPPPSSGPAPTPWTPGPYVPPDPAPTIPSPGGGYTVPQPGPVRTSGGRRDDRPEPAPAPFPSPIPPTSTPPASGGGIPWDPGASRPSYDPPGYHWDENLANFVADPTGPDRAGATPPSTPPAAPGGAPASSGYTQGMSLATAMQQANALYGYAKHTDPNYWAAMWAKDPEYTWRRLMGEGAGPQDAPGAGQWAGGDPAAEVFHAPAPIPTTWSTREDPGYQAAPVPNPAATTQQTFAGTNPGGFDDPSSMLFLNQAMNRLDQLNTPRVDPYEQLLQLMALMRVGDLGGAPYTAGEDAALVTKYRDPLTQARDAAKQTAAEEMARRGIGPTSGLFHQRMSEIDQAYERGIASGSNDLAVKAVDEKQRRADLQLSILNDLLGVSRSSQDRTDARAREALTTAEIFPNFDEKRLNMLLGASGEGAASPASILGNLVNLQSINSQSQTAANRLGFDAQGRAQQNSANSASSWGQILGYLLSAMK